MCSSKGAYHSTHVTGHFSGGLCSLEGNSIQPEVMARHLHLLPRCLVNFLYQRIIKKMMLNNLQKGYWHMSMWICMCLYLGL